MLPDIDVEHREWIASRAVEMLHTLLHVSDVETREAYVAMMLTGAFHQGFRSGALGTSIAGCRGPGTAAALKATLPPPMPIGDH